MDKDFDEFRKKELNQGKLLIKKTVNPELAIYQQYIVLKDLLFTPNFVQMLGFGQGLEVPSLGVLALELAPNFSIKKVDENHLEVPSSGESLHVIYLPKELPDIKNFNKVFEIIKTIYPNRTYAYLWHKNGIVPTGKVQCNCEGGAVEHHHIIVLPKWVSLVNLQDKLEKYDFPKSILTAFDQQDEKLHPDFCNYIPGKTFGIKICHNSVPFSTVIEENNQLSDLPAYCIGISDAINNFEKSVIIRLNVKGASGFLRTVLTSLCDDTNQYERSYRKIVSYIKSDNVVKEKMREKLLKDKYLLKQGINTWNNKFNV